MMQRIYIFGAHSRAQTLGVYLQSLHPGLVVEAYLYDNEEHNPERIGNSPVIHMEDYAGLYTGLHTEYPVYIGTRGVYHGKLVRLLEEAGFEMIYPVTAELDLKLRNAYLRKYYAGIGRDFIKLNELKEKDNTAREALRNKIYVVKSVFDQPLQEECRLASYEREIYAGAALSGGCLIPGILRDDTGDNISWKNRQYCELTALYWIWKHAEEEVIGLAHYRRHFLLPSGWLETMQDNGIDVILPVPLYVLPDLTGNYKSRHDAGDWDFLMGYLKGSSDSFCKDAEEFFRGNLYSPCNMFIMRREVLDEFCSWLFPILEAVTRHGGEKEDRYLNRYPGFIAERLLTFFFEKKRGVYKTVYADKNFIK